VRGILNERRELAAGVHRSLRTVRVVVHGGEADFARRWRFGRDERNIAPLNLPVRRPQEMQLNSGSGCAGWSFIDIGHFSPAVSARHQRACVAWILRFGGGSDTERKVGHNSVAALNVPARIVAPNNPRQHAASWHNDILRTPPRGKAVVPPGSHGKGFLPPAV
jgi:hypothetical protein